MAMEFEPLINIAGIFVAAGSVYAGIRRDLKTLKSEARTTRRFIAQHVDFHIEHCDKCREVNCHKQIDRVGSVDLELE